MAATDYVEKLVAQYSENVKISFGKRPKHSSFSVLIAFVTYFRAF